MLTPPSPSSSPSLSPNDTVNTRKRQRSQSMQSEPPSSPKRSVSEDPSQDGARTGQSQGTSSLSSLDSDVDAYMTEQGEDLSSTMVPSTTTAPSNKLSSVKSRMQSPMEIGDVWFVISSSWFRRWCKAVTGEVDKEGPLEEKDVGPVDNTDIVGTGGDGINQESGPDDYVFVPEQVMVWFTNWYGQPEYPLPRKVIARGVRAEPSLELHPPRVKVHVLTKNLVPGVIMPPQFVTISVTDTIEHLYKTIPDSVIIADSRPCRIWKLSEGDASWDQLSCSPEQLKQRGATTLKSSQRIVEEELVEAGDSFAVEFQEDGRWLVEETEVTAQPALTRVTAKLFGSGDGLFDQMQAKATPSSVSKATSSPAKPVLSNVSNRVGSSGVITRSKVGGMEPGTLGLGNLGNTCFMNSALQCLVHTKELADYFLIGVFEDELNPENPLGMGGAIAQAFGALLQRIWSTTPSSTSYSPREFKQALQRFAPQFSGYQQHDSQELVAFLLDGLHEDLNRVLKKPYVEKPDWESGGDKELVQLANESWKGYMRRNDSVIVDLFQGQYQSTLVCPECSKVSITFDPFMYLTLPLPVQKKWRHSVFFIPWDTSKEHVKVPVEINRDASFKELRQLLGRWMDVDPDYLLTLEVFSGRFYKDLDDIVLVGDMADNDIIVCFELPCHAQQSRTYKQDPDDPAIVPVVLCDTLSSRSYSRNPNLFGCPFVVVVDRQQARDPDAMYDAVADRLQRWTENVRDLSSWEAGPLGSLDPVQIPIAEHPKIDSITEITPNGDVITLQEPTPEEGDITDEKGMVDLDHDNVNMDDSDDEPRKVGFKRNIFKIHIQSGNEKYGVGAHYSYSFETLEQRAAARQLAQDDFTPELLQEGDVLFCEFDENMKAYFFGDDRFRYDQGKWNGWKEHIHPEYTVSREAAAAKKNQGISLQDCLDEFTREERLGEDDLWYCPRCKKHQQATKRFDLWKVPDILVVHLKRFSNSRTLRDKIDTLVDFPVEGLDISAMVGERQVCQRLKTEGIDITELGLSDTDESLMYDLYAVDEHTGGLGGGHYRAYAYNHITDKWYHFDDSYVTPTRAEAAVNASAYLLFYRRRTNRPIGGKSHAMVEAARHKSTPSPSPTENQATQLPTPPLEPAQLSSQPLAEGEVSTANSLPKLNSYNGDWPTPLSNAPSSPASSPPPLDDGKPHSFVDPQFDDGLQSSLDPLAISAHQFDFPDPSSSRNSPTSSIEAEFDRDTDWNGIDGDGGDWLGHGHGRQIVSSKLGNIPGFTGMHEEVVELPESDDGAYSSAAVGEGSGSLSDIDV